jgi:DNA repair protein RecN (Recombination protein N)
MIVELTVENLAIIERAHLRLGTGLTVLTGETGAGKSLLIDAVELALGERADPELVRSGAPRASVTVKLDLSRAPAALAQCQSLEVPLEGAGLTVQREVAAEGRSSARISGKPASAGTLRRLGALLIDLHGQHDHQSLLDSDRHIGFLDAWIGGPALALLESTSSAYARASEAQRRLAALRDGMRDRERRLDLLRFQVNEIEEIGPRIGEMDELEAQLSRLQHSEKLASASCAALSVLADEENCAVDQLGYALKQIESAARFDPALDEFANSLREASILAAETAQRLRAYVDGLDTDPRSLEDVAGRIDALRRLRRKYGADETEILAFLAGAQEQLGLLESGEASEGGLRAAAERAQTDLEAAAAELTTLRLARAAEFSERVQTQLRDLAMDRAVFAVDRKPKPPDAAGADAIEFFFSANLGEPPRPLSRIASGGEISRVMLAIKTAMAGRAGVPTLIFDEVDAGLGGRAAVSVARKLSTLGEHYQVLVISHLPQIAAYADHHLRIEKGESNGRVATDVRELNATERVEEIARMMAGDHASDAVRASARELLAARVLK